MRDHDYTYAIYHRDGKELLFNTRRDPYQLTDLASDRAHAATLTHYRAMAQAWRKQHNDTFEACSYYERWTKDRNIVNTATGVTQNLDVLPQINARWFPDLSGDRPVSSFPIGV